MQHADRFPLKSRSAPLSPLPLKLDTQLFTQTSGCVERCRLQQKCTSASALRRGREHVKQQSHANAARCTAARLLQRSLISRPPARQRDPDPSRGGLR